MNEPLTGYLQWKFDKMELSSDFWFLISELDRIPYEPVMHDDRNRYETGHGLRYQFAYESGITYADIDADTSDILYCSILDLIVSMALDFENRFMFDPTIGDRTGLWAQEFIDHLGLSRMTNDNLDIAYVHMRIEAFNRRRYSPNGDGNLFYLPEANVDLRSISLWEQMNCYAMQLMH